MIGFGGILTKEAKVDTFSKKEGTHDSLGCKAENLLKGTHTANGKKKPTNRWILTDPAQSR